MRQYSGDFLPLIYWPAAVPLRSVLHASECKRDPTFYSNTTSSWLAPWPRHAKHRRTSRASLVALVGAVSRCGQGLGQLVRAAGTACPTGWGGLPWLLGQLAPGLGQLVPAFGLGWRTLSPMEPRRPRWETHVWIVVCSAALPCWWDSKCQPRPGAGSAHCRGDLGGHKSKLDLCPYGSAAALSGPGPRPVPKLGAGRMHTVAKPLGALIPPAFCPCGFAGQAQAQVMPRPRARHCQGPRPTQVRTQLKQNTSRGSLLACFRDVFEMFSMCFQ